jgi:hypothetical protein
MASEEAKPEVAARAEVRPEKARTGTAGWKQFLHQKQAMLHDYDEAKIQAQGHATTTSHGPHSY